MYMDDGLTQRDRGSRGRGTRRGRGTVARERDVHSGKYSYNIYYKYYYHFRRQCFYYKYGEVEEAEVEEAEVKELEEVGVEELWQEKEMFTLVNVAITFTTNIIIILGDNVSITSMDEGLTQRGRGSRGRGTRRGRGTVARERDVHSGKYSYNIYYKFIIIIIRRQCFYYKYG